MGNSENCDGTSETDPQVQTITASPQDEFTQNTNGNHSGFRRQRASRACETCHGRKVRCDAASLGIPCTNCVAFSIECKIPAPKRKKAISVAGRTKDEDSDSKSIPTHIESSKLSHQASAGSTSTTSEVPNKQVSEEDILQNKPNESGSYSQLLKPKFARAPIKEAGRVAYLGESSNLSLLVHDRHGTSDVVHYPLPENIRGSRAQLTELDNEEIDILNRRGAFLLPPRGLCDELVDAFFRYIAPIVPVINRNRFMQRYKDPLNPPSLLLLQAILLAGSRVCTNPALMDASGSTTPAAMTFYKRAKALYDANYEDDRVTIVQSLVLMGWYWEGPEDVTKNVFYWSRVATIVAQGSGMHRSVERSQLSRTDKRLWKRIWWTLFTRDRSVAVALGRPVHINTDDSDVEMVSEDDFREDEPGVSLDYPPDPLHVKFFLHYVKLCDIMGLVLSQQYSVASRARRQHAIDLTHSDMALADWMINVPDEMKYHMNDARRQNFWAALLHSTYYTTLCLLHRAHMPPATVSDPARLHGANDAYPSRKIAFQAAANITTIIQNLRAHDELRFCPAFIMFSALIMQVYQVRSSQPSVVSVTQDRMKVCMEALKEISRIWLVAKMVYTLFDSILGNKALEERLQKASGYRQSHDRKTKEEHRQQSERDSVLKRKFDDIELGSLHTGPAPQVSYERSRPQTPAPVLSIPMNLNNPSLTLHGQYALSRSPAQLDSVVDGQSSRSLQYSSPLQPNSMLPTTPPDIFLVTRTSPPISQSMWENFKPTQLFPDEPGTSSLAEFSPPQNDTGLRSIENNTMNASLRQPFPAAFPSPSSRAFNNLPELDKEPQTGPTYLRNSNIMSGGKAWTGALDLDVTVDSPEDTWSNSSAGNVQTAPPTLNVEDWYQFFGLSAGFDMNNLGISPLQG